MRKTFEKGIESQGRKSGVWKYRKKSLRKSLLRLAT
jgi:hypothetical protein